MLTRRSIVLAAAEAGADFNAHRVIGDSVLASEIAFRGWLAEPDLCVLLASRSYLTCHRILGGEWQLYAELSGRLAEIIEVSRAAVAQATRS